MGVHGLWKLLESTGKPINPETLEGKILAVDISIWLNQAVKGVRDREGNSVQNAHLLTLFNRLCKLLFFRIRPVFIFDGEAPLLKKQTLANRRQRKEEMSVASRQTNEKLLKTFLKRQAIRAAMGSYSQEPLPSISSVRREEVDDIYVLPSLERTEQSSEDEAEAEWEENIQDQHRLQEEIFQNLNSMDIDSEEFAQLPAEMKHEILRDMKEFSKRRRTMFQKPPKKSKEFSQYQLAGLLNRNKLNQRMEGVEREMAQRGLGVLQEENRGCTVEARSLVSEDTARYVLIKGSKSQEKTLEKEVTAVPWTSYDWVGRQKPEPLWCPLSEKSLDKKPSSLSKNPIAQDVTPSLSLPPSPRTLKAIQAAMIDSSSDEENCVSSPTAVRSQQSGEQLSPRTLLAIQRALTEEEVDPSTPVCQSSTGMTSLSRSPTHHLADSVSSSEREMDDSMEDRGVCSGSLLDSKELSLNCGNITVSNVGLTPPDSESSLSSTPQLEEEAEKEPKPDKNPESEPLNSPHCAILETAQTKGSGLQLGPQLLPSGQCSPSSRQEITCVPGSSPEDTLQMVEEEAAKRVFVTTDDDSDSEANFIDVSDLEEEDSEKEGKEEEPALEEVSRKEMRSEDGSLAEPTSHGPPQLDSPDKEEEKMQSSQESLTDTAENKWEHMDMEELLQLESTLQSEQSTLGAQKQQQERMATTITGQMYLESQELLRLFGVPYFVAPMEAEAQCAVLERLDQTHGTITDDSDIWLFGGRHVYKNFFTHNKYVELYQYLDIQNQLGLDQNKLINLAYLLGSDYTEGVPGVGYVTGMEILNEFPGSGLEPLTNLRSNWWSEVQDNKRLAPNPNDTKVKKKLRKIQLPPGFPNPVVAQAYLHPTVDDSCASFTWGQPHLELIKDFCLSRFGWSSRRTEEVLQPVMKQLNMHQKQLRIDSFFRLEQQEKQVIRSQRLRRAVTCLKRKEEEENSMEEGACSPVKAKNMKVMETNTESPATWGGGFLASQDIIPNFGPDEERTAEGSGALRTPPKTEPKLSPIKARRSSSSSEGDSDADVKVAMVTARSVFENKPRGRGRRSGRGKNPRKR